MMKTAACLALALTAAAVSRAEEPTSLRDAYEARFDIGTALSESQLLTPELPVLDLVARQFSVVTPENVMKWEKIHPEPQSYDFRAADALVDFAELNGLKVVGHTVVWHSQCPDWVFEDATGRPISREALIERLRDHIQQVVGRYKGRIEGWDVVNEAFLDDGSLRDTKWRQVLGDDYLAEVFQMVHEADPDTELYYNDYSMTAPGKREAVVRMAADFHRRGVPIDGIGMQGHWGLDYPSEAEIDASLADFAATGLKVMITELDMNILPRPDQNTGADVSQRGARRAGMDPYRDGLPPNVQQKLADRYAMAFRQFVKHDDAVTRVTFWGVHDGHSWRNNWPIPGRVAHPLVFDRDLHPKPAYDAILKVAEEN